MISIMTKYSVNGKGNYYYVQFWATEASGKRVHKCLSTGVKVQKGNKRKAEEVAAQIVSEYESKAAINLTSANNDLLTYINNSITEISKCPNKEKIASEIMLLNLIANYISKGSVLTGNDVALSNLLDAVTHYIVNNAFTVTNNKGGQYLYECIEEYIGLRKSGISVTTYNNYISMYNKHIKPYFSDVIKPEQLLTLNDLTPSAIDKYIAKKSEEVSANTIIKHIQLIKASLSQAQHDGKIINNPAMHVHTPTIDEPDHDIYGEEELNKALQIVKGTTIETPVVLATFLGLRRSEIIGLRWKNVDFDKSEIRICDTVVVSHGKPVFKEGKTKTQKSKSTMVISSYLCEYLKQVKAKQDIMPRRTQEYKDFVCVDEEGQLIHPDTLSDDFPKLMEANGLKRIHLHELRHSLITLANKYYGLDKAQKIARHSTPSLTDKVYIHSQHDEFEPIMEALSDKILNIKSHND